ncbi:alpha-hydroxy-acid oxidizing enzyme [Phyllobacterium phragmitis]|uniref:Alpha-hydroxy-acid oxidizing enzyme n=1 Tax=Phyllobacterium phragmitis TaxID=2670329 RepID=A0A2S9IJ95_9HYPH|nr:alpha-hydroxy acid oxidase [Phyllobacterium phragmitis]PRD40613.1 alpha-hydroxy-acid oxidizing enzyme [Phyllobacterium phragmitis]
MTNQTTTHVASDGPAGVSEARREERRPRSLRDVFNLEDFEAAARKRLPRGVFGYIAGYVENGAAFRSNRSDFEAIRMIPRILAGLAARDQSRTLFGERWQHPFGIAPMGLSALAAYDGDIVLARSAAACGIPAVLSATSLISLERVAREGGTRWFQAYLPGDDTRVIGMIDRLAAAGYETLVITADVPVAGNREDSKRDRFGAPMKPSLNLGLQVMSRPGWLFGTAARTLKNHGMPHFENADVDRGPAIVSQNVIRSFGGRGTFSWRHAAIARERWKGKLVIKGVLSPEDARRANELGADGIIVSNHGGRQLDYAISPVVALPAVKAEAGKMAVMLDSGVRRGSDVLKAIALGADFVFVGRPFLFAAAVAGDAGVRHAVSLLSSEIDRDMAMLGAASLDEINQRMLADDAALDRK